MKYFINESIVLSRAPEGPLVAQLDGFAGFLTAKGYSWSAIHRKVLLAACFSQWLEQREIGLCGLTSDHPDRYLSDRARCLRPSDGDAAALRHLMGYLRLEGVISAEKALVRPMTAVDRCVQAYTLHLRDMRGLATTTVDGYTPFVLRFLQHCFGDGEVVPSRLSAKDVVGFVQQEVARTTSRKRKKLMTSALRSFLRYLAYCDGNLPELASCVPSVANWSLTSLPCGISADQVDRLLAGMDRRSALGRRDYAILLLLARLGLRSSEVAFLELDDIDWNSGTLHTRTKGGKRTAFALSQAIGDAIADYLCHGRPRSDSRRVFLRARAPNSGFLYGRSVGSVVRNALRRTGVNAPNGGTHQFRHGLATEMMRSGASLDMIGEVLGHRHPDTTRIYARVDLEALRSLALPWPGAVR